MEKEPAVNHEQRSGTRPMTTPEASVEEVLRATGVAPLSDDAPAEAVEAALRRLADHVKGTEVDDLRRETPRNGAIQALKNIGWTAPARAVAVFPYSVDLAA